MKKIKVMSFNMRTQVEADGVNQFRSRKDRILDMLTREDPDVIGFQEVTDEMRAWTREALGSKYTVVGCGRMKDYTGESVAIAVRNSLFEIISLESFWLSDTPSVSGSRYENAEQSNWPRMTVSAFVKCVGIDEPFHIINTHLDHIGQRARYLGMEQVADYVSGINGKFIYTGDMNAAPDAEEIEIFNKRTEAIGGKDATAELGGTFHNFGRREQKSKIDYIFTNADFENSHIVPDEGKDGLYYSDHHAVCSDILL